MPISEIRETHKHVAAWMRDEKRPLPWLQSLLGARAWVHYQPLGSVGIIAPLELPHLPRHGPLIGVLAAGNRAMLKPSEFHAPGRRAVRHPVPALLRRQGDRGGDRRHRGGHGLHRTAFDHLVFTGAWAPSPGT